MKTVLKEIGVTVFFPSENDKIYKELTLYHIIVTVNDPVKVAF